MQVAPFASTEHCSPEAQPHWGMVSLHGLSAQIGPEPVEVALLPVDVVVLLVDVVSLPVDVVSVPVLLVPLEVFPAVVLPAVVTPPPGPLESPPSPPVVAALAQAASIKIRALKRRSERGRMRTPRERKKSRRPAYARHLKGQRSARAFVNTIRRRPGPA
jgi:hypothetical protein